MSRSRKGTPSGMCEGCPKCSWFPERLQRNGRRLVKVMDREMDAEADLGLIRYDVWARDLEDLD